MTIENEDQLDKLRTVGRVVAGTDDHVETTGIMGYPVFYAAKKVPGGYERADGKRFNMSYTPDKLLNPGSAARVITLRKE